MFYRVGQVILIMVAVCVVGSADTAQGADRIGRSMGR